MPDVNPPNYTTPIGQVRALIPDVEQLPDPTDSTVANSYLFSDDLLGVYIALAEDNNVKRAAAMALDVMGSTELYILKVITENDLVTNGAAVAQQWGLRSLRLKAEADSDDQTGVASFVIAGPRPREPLFDPEKAALYGDRYIPPIRLRRGF